MLVGTMVGKHILVAIAMPVLILLSYCQIAFAEHQMQIVKLNGVDGDNGTHFVFIGS